jgi:DNA (cytosine-5)-methyltransferase 1
MAVNRPRLLDLFCCEGGAGRGYQLAGWDVTGVDLRRIHNYPGEFHRADALDYARAHAGEFDAIVGSPPCQRFTDLYHRHKEEEAGLFEGERYPDLIAATREVTIASGLPYIIENVEGAPLLDPVVLCGSMFGLGTDCVDGKWRQLRRHRLFESNIALTAPGGCAHDGQPVGVYGVGGGGPNAATRGYKATRSEALAAMGTPWMTAYGVSQAIPPAYTEHLGSLLLANVNGVATLNPW